MDLLDIIHPSDRGRTLAFLGRLDDEGGHSRWKTRVLKKDGKHVWIEWTLNPSSEDRRLYIFGTDVTEKEAARESMMKQLLKYNLEDGNVYIVKEERMERSAEAFMDLLNVGYDGVAFSRKMDTVFN